MKVLISIKATDIQQIEYTIWRIASEWKIDKKDKENIKKIRKVSEELYL